MKSGSAAVARRLDRTLRRAVALALLALVASSALRAAGDRAAAAQEIRAEEFVRADGAELFVSIRGADRRAPVLLWLHGGPGGAERPLFRLYDGELEDSFVVAYWDQRGAGRSFDPDADLRQLTVARHLADLDVVVRRLSALLGCARVVLVGHSWGGALGLLYARDHPERVSTLIAVSPLVSARAAQEAEHAFVAAEAATRGDEDTAARLRELGAPPYRDAARALAQERLADRYGAVFHRPPSRVGAVLRGMLGGIVMPWELPRLIRGNQRSLEAMQSELIDLDVASAVPAVEVPVRFFLGRYDQHVDARFAADYFARLRAPSKRLVWFEDSAHNPPFEEPERFAAAVREATR